MQPTKNKQAYWRSVFRKVMSYYDELKSSTGTMSCQGFYKSLQLEGTNGGKHNPRVVRTSPSDLICDIEITARKVLTKVEYKFFHRLYIKKDAPFVAQVEDKSPDNKHTKLKHQVQEKLGLAFKMRGIHPLAKYLKPRDLR